MNILPTKTLLGKLKYFEIYDDFYGPKCFTVKNELEHLYLVYWSGDYENYTCSKWVYMPISPKKLDELLREEISFHKAFKDSNHLYVVTIFEDEMKASTVALYDKKNHSDVNLPPNMFSIDPLEIQRIAPESKWDFNLRIAKSTDGKNNPDTTVVTKVIDAFGQLIESLMKDYTSKKVPKIYPLTACYGSFDMKLGTNDHERASVAIEQFGELLGNPLDLEDKLRNLGLDPYRLKDLLDIVNLHKLELTLKPKTSELMKKPVLIKSSNLQGIIKWLEESSVTYIDSNKVPQANNLDRVIDVVQLRLNGDELSPELVNGVSSDRQVDYYIHGAKCLGLLHENCTIAAPGRILCNKLSKTAKYQYLADRFESSDFGWAWMKWANVTNICDLEPSTSTLFIKECVKGLNGGTVKRRASSLSSWLILLQQYRRNYSDTNHCD